MAASGSGGSRADNGYGSQQPRRRKGPGALATAYLVIYNVVMTAGWLVIAVGLVRAYLAKGSYHSLYYSIEKPLKFFQTGALLEILHCAFGIVPSSVVLTAFQVMSRVFLTWAVTHSVKEYQRTSALEGDVLFHHYSCIVLLVFLFCTGLLNYVVQTEDSVLLFVVAWTITEIIRYSFYTFSLLNHLPYLIKWARYTLFIVLYPMGVSGELLTIYAALPFVRQSGLYSINLPNKYNFSFDYYTFLILVMISYIPNYLFGLHVFHQHHQTSAAALFSALVVFVLCGLVQSTILFMFCHAGFVRVSHYALKDQGSYQCIV